ncbi:GMC family oxidoreductase [Pontibacter saemangeumensis]|uniref:GMC family oxidoreductase n=1 Tax=Pontibacter saemangeumensis TaxID=1084525 RepID=A0ABP8LQL2_9BACT
MHTDARTLENGSLIEGDICIVGAGPAGISMALEWQNTPYKVILLEGGGFEVESDVQDLYRGQSIGQRYFPLQSARLHYFGGTSGHWAGFCSTLDPIDFQKRAWVPHSGWPIQFSDLDPFYPRAQKLLELGPYEYGLNYWQKQQPGLTPLPLDEKVFWNKVWQFSPPTRFGNTYRDAILKARNIHLYTYANAVDIRADENVSQVKEISVKNLAGKTHTVRARHFVLACSAIQNARLLLASDKQAPSGLGNDHDLVGRYFMEHLEVASADLFLTSPAALRLYLWEFFTTKMRTELAITAEKQEAYKILNGTASLWPKAQDTESPAFIDTFPDSAQATVREWEEREQQFKAGKTESKPPALYKQFSLFTRMEQSPNPLSRVTLDREKDALGMPRVVLDWQLLPLEKRSIYKLYQLIGQQIGMAGIGRVRVQDWLQEENDTNWPDTLGGGWHHMGTTRMHDDPKQGVVDADCKVHGIRNLYMAGSSCFTTGGAANPTLSLVALSLRLSDHLKQKINQSA